jgi:hypothetical protein
MGTTSIIQPSENGCVDNSVELFVLLGHYSELEFEGIATGDEFEGINRLLTKFDVRLGERSRHAAMFLRGIGISGLFMTKIL